MQASIGFALRAIDTWDSIEYLDWNTDLAMNISFTRIRLKALSIYKRRQKYDEHKHFHHHFNILRNHILSLLGSYLEYD